MSIIDAEKGPDSLGQLLTVLTDPVVYAEKSKGLMEKQAKVNDGLETLKYLHELKVTLAAKEKDLEAREDASAAQMAEALAKMDEYEAKLAKYNRFIAEN